MLPKKAGLPFGAGRIERKPLNTILALGISLKEKIFRRSAVRRKRFAVENLARANSFESRIYSQNGEDGIIREIFARIPHQRFFVEIGVENGEECNSALLSRHYNWRGLMIEGNAAHETQLRQSFTKFGVAIESSFVDRDNIATIFERYGVPKDLDLLSIDIDGNDIFIWRALSDYRPSCVVIEYNAFWGSEISRSIVYDAERRFAGNRYFGASLTALKRVGEQLGYALIATDSRGVNAFFIRRDLLARCGFSELSPREAYHNRPLLGRLLPAGAGPYVEI